MNQRIITLIILIGLVVGGGFLAYRLLVPPAEAAQGPLYATEPVTRGDIDVGVDAQGPLDPADGGGIQVPGGYGPYGPLPGPSNYVIEEVLAKEGDHVTPGQVLVRLSATELQQQIDTQRAKVESDRQALARMLGVGVDQIGSVDPTRGITLRAPIDGRISGLNVQEGQTLKQGQIVAHVVDDAKFRVLAKLVPLEFQQVKEGTECVLKFSQFDGFVNAKVVAVNPDPVPEDSSTLIDVMGPSEGGNQGYQFVYYVTLEGDNAGLIRPGMLAQVGVPAAAPDGSGSATGIDSVMFFRYYAEVDSYGSEEQVLCGAEAIATKVYVHDFQRVSAGDAIVTLSGEDAQQTIMDMMDQFQVEQANLKALESQLDSLEIRSTMEGVVASISAQVGQSVQAGQWLGSVYNTANMRMWVQVDDIDVLQVQQGAPVTITVDAVPGREFAGEVEYVSQMGKDETGITQFSVTIKVEGGPELRPGMQANAHIDAGNAAGVLLIPLEGIFEEDGQAKVEVLLDDGLTKVVPVQLGLMNDRYAEVTSGLEEGDLVIVGSTADLLPSQTIEGGDSLLPSGGSGDEGGDGGSSGGNGGE